MWKNRTVKVRGAGGYLQASVKGKHMFGLALEANVSWIEWLGKIQADSSTIQPMAEQQNINNRHAILLMPHQILLSTVAIKREIDAFQWVTCCIKYYKMFLSLFFLVEPQSWGHFGALFPETARRAHHHGDVCPDDPHSFKELSPTHTKPQRRRHMKGVCVDGSACARLLRSVLLCFCVCEILSMSQRSRSLKITRGDWCEVPGFFLLFIFWLGVTRISLVSQWGLSCCGHLKV